MVASRKNTRRNDPFEAIVETWIARLLLRDNLWRKIRMCDCTPSDSIMGSSVAHSLAMDVTNLFVENRAKPFLSDGTFASIKEFGKKVMDWDDTELKDCLTDLECGREWLRDTDGLKEDEIPPLAKAKRRSFLTALRNEHRSYFEDGQALLNNGRRGDLGTFWVQQRGRGVPKALQGGLERLEKRFGKTSATRVQKAFPPFLRTNFSILADAFHLTPLMVETIAFLLLAERSDPLETALGLNPTCYMTYSAGVETIACVLHASSSEIEAILADDGPLVSSGLLRYAEESDRSTFGFIEFSEGIPWNRFLERELSEEVIFRDLVRQAPMSSLTTEDYRHLPLVQSTLLPYLRTVLDEKRQGVNILLYGPPGTGKTAFALWVARELGRPLLRRTYAELASCWVGETEQNIAKAFRQAERDKAVLLIDEADSFFRSREMSVRSWETTQVNEMLARLENFNGVFFATTNLMRDFDEAAMRRFDWKVPFGFLRPEARLALAKRYVESYKLPWTESAEALLTKLDKLTPGDYSAVARQVRFRPLRDADDWVARLKAEEDAKTVNGPKNTIGFA